MFTSITIIFNPNSTGDAPEKAHELAGQLRQALPKVQVKLQETKHAGHAEELAYRAAKISKEPLIVSASGDGGYHEVINGAMRAADEGAKPICAVYASGNANDHHRIVREQPLFDAIVAHDISLLDVLEVRWADKRRYAHSYVGLGLTPEVAKELNRHDLNPLTESLIVIKTFLRFTPFEIIMEDKKIKLDSLIFGNISGMAKVLNLGKNSKTDDGLFEVVRVPHRNKLSKLLWSIKSATIGLGNQPQRKEITFTTTKKIPMQLDGEVFELATDTGVHVTAAHRELRTVR